MLTTKDQVSQTLRHGTGLTDQGGLTDRRLDGIGVHYATGWITKIPNFLRTTSTSNIWETT